jgi:hypothetical protein
MLYKFAHVILLQGLSAKKERNVAITALARKLICLIYHLLINQELYQEDGGRSRKRRSRPAKSENESSPSEVDRLGDKIAAIVDAFYHLKPRSRKNALMRELGALNMSDFGPGRPSDGGG